LFGTARLAEFIEYFGHALPLMAGTISMSVTSLVGASMVRA
jgi:hypothetical protein